MGELPQCRNGTEIKRVAGVSFKCPDTPFAWYHLHISLVQNILHTIQPFGQGGVHTPFQHHRFVHTADFLKKRKILHISGSDLQNIGVFTHPADIPGIDNLGDHRQSGRPAGFFENLESVQPQTLKRVGRGARLECAPPQNISSGGFDLLRYRERLLLGFDAARACNDGEIITDNTQLYATWTS